MARSGNDKRLKEMAGAGGFEPPNGGIKIRCLTAWLRPIALPALGAARGTIVSRRRAGNGAFRWSSGLVRRPPRACDAGAGRLYNRLSRRDLRACGGPGWTSWAEGRAERSAAW